MLIGELSRVTETSPRSLRYYEQLGLITSTRQPNGYREYDETAIAAVMTIRSLLDLGFPTALIGEILPCTGEQAVRGDCSSLVAHMTSIRDDMDAKARQLSETSETLTAFLARAGRPV